MDPITHAAIGAVCAQSVASPRKLYASSVLVAILGAMAPDLDIFVAMSFANSDPLAFFKMHRNITHSIFFAPIGAWLVAGAAYVLLTLRISFRRAYVFSLLGYISHLFADWCTGYGMNLWLPLSDVRVAGHICHSLVPLLSLPLWYMAYRARRFEYRHIARFGVAFLLIYVWFSAVQRDKVIAFVRSEHPAARNIVPEAYIPFLWRVVYIDGDKIHVDSHVVMRLVRKQQSVVIPYQPLESIISQERYAQHREILSYLYKFFDDLIYVCGDKLYFVCWARSYRIAVDDKYIMLDPDKKYARHTPSIIDVLRSFVQGCLQSDAVPGELALPVLTADPSDTNSASASKQRPRLKKIIRTNVAGQRAALRG